MNYIYNKIAYIIIAIAFICAAVVAYWLLFPYRTLVINQIPVPIFDQQVKNGGAVLLDFDSCNYTDSEVKIESQLITDTIQVDLPTAKTHLPLGCNHRNAPVSLPKLTNLGDYHIHYKLTWQLNPLKKEVLEFDTASFPIVK